MCATGVVTALSCVLTLLVVQESLTSPVGKCIHEGDALADDHNCAVYWACLKNGPVPFHCPGKLIFDPNVRVCRHPDEAKCDVHIPQDSGVCWAAETCPFGVEGWSMPHAGSCQAYCRCDAHGVARIRRCPHGQQFCSERRTCVDASEARCRWRLLGDCPADLTCPNGHNEIPYALPHPRDCSSFCLCVDGRPSLQRCPRGLFFSRMEMTCVKDRQPQCEVEEVCPAVGSCPPVGSLHLPHADDCTLFCRCDHGVPRLDRCPDGLFFDPILQNCDWSWRARCKTSELKAKSDRCPAVGTCPFPDPLNYTVHLPHAFNCTLFCRCDHGNPKEECCPAGLHFNPRLQICDRPEVAGCLKDELRNLKEHHYQEDTKDVWNHELRNLKENHYQEETKELWNHELRNLKEHHYQEETKVVSNHCPSIGKCPPWGIGHLPHATNCSLYCSCHDGKSTVERCPLGLQFNPVSKVCDWPAIAGCGVATLNNGDTAECPAIGSCSQSDFVGSVNLLPHQRSCSFFCRCNSGKPYLNRCPAGLHFSPTRKVCEWPVHAGCDLLRDTW